MACLHKMLRAIYRWLVTGIVRHPETPRVLWDACSTYRLYGLFHGMLIAIYLLLWGLTGRQHPLGILVYALYLLYMWGGTKIVKRRFEKRLRRADYLLCPECGYNLCGTASPSRCPECGRAYDRDEVVTLWKSGEWRQMIRR